METSRCPPNIHSKHRQKKTTGRRQEWITCRWPAHTCHMQKTEDGLQLLQKSITFYWHPWERTHRYCSPCSRQPRSHYESKDISVAKKGKDYLLHMADSVKSLSVGNRTHNQIMTSWFRGKGHFNAESSHQLCKFFQAFWHTCGVKRYQKPPCHLSEVHLVHS